MTVRLHEKGVFSWSEWAEALSHELYKPGRRADASDYFDCWVAALSRLVTELSITSQDNLDQLTQSWQRAAEATPHGSRSCWKTIRSADFASIILFFNQ